MVAPMYNHDDFKRTEHEILGLLDWKLQIPTIFDILEYYISQGVVFNTDTVSGEEIQNSSIQTPSPNGAQASYIEQKFASPFIHNNEKNHSFLINSIASKSTGIQFYGKITNEKKIYEMISGMEKDMVKLTGLMVKDAGFYNWEPNVLAAGAVGFLRKLNNVTPIWYRFTFYIKFILSLFFL